MPGSWRGINWRSRGAGGRKGADASAAKTRRANGGGSGRKAGAHPVPELEDRRSATRPLVAAGFREEAG